MKTEAALKDNYTKYYSFISSSRLIVFSPHTRRRSVMKSGALVLHQLKAGDEAVSRLSHSLFLQRASEGKDGGRKHNGENERRERGRGGGGSNSVAAECEKTFKCVFVSV